jgi:protein-S-isoprenylcysteine O-methyltransferase Ste14
MRYLESKIPPPIVAVIFGVIMWGTALLIPAENISPVIKYSTVLLFLVVGSLFLAPAGISFIRAKTTVNPLKPETTTSLVTTGIYQITRNPMYVGFSMFLCAWAAYLGSFMLLAFVALYMLYIHRFQILPEEKALETIFAEDFFEYKRKVRPWF